MLERDLRKQAISLATQLPDDQETARQVYAYLGELIDKWIYTDVIENKGTSLAGGGGIRPRKLLDPVT
jgi:hypothetical protein